MAIPVYISRGEAPNAPGQGVQPLPLPNLPDGSPVLAAAERLDNAMSAQGAAISKFGETLGNVAVKLADAQDETNAARARTDYLTRLSGLEAKYSNDPDFQSVGANFARDRGDLETELLGGIADPKRRAETQLHMRVAGLRSQAQVDSNARSREADFNVAALNEREAYSLRQVGTTAPSSIERLALLKLQNDDYDAQAKAGWISARDAFARKLNFQILSDDIDARRDIQSDPRTAVARLADPKWYPALSPERRQTLVEQAQSASDGRITTEIVATVNFNPPGAAASVGRITKEAHGDAIFAQGILPIENARQDQKLISPAGAVGLAQIMPATARGMAQKLGLADIAALDDVGLTKRLQDDPALNKQLGLAYWHELAVQFQGNVPVMAAAYNAGPGRAAAWAETAQQKFGADFTAAEYASVIDIAETRNYIGKLYRQLQADPTGAGLTPGARERAALTVGHAIDAEIAEKQRQARANLEAWRAIDDPTVYFKDGITPDPVREAQYEQLLRDAGDGKGLRELQFRRAMLPEQQKVFASPPAQAEAMVASAEQQYRVNPSVALHDRAAALREALRVQKEFTQTQPVTLIERSLQSPAIAIDPRFNPADNEARKALALRGAQANEAARVYQAPALPFKPAEAAALKERWRDAGPDERFSIISSFAETMQGAAYYGALKQVGGDDPAVAMAGRVARDRPQLAREIVQGAALLDAPEAKAKPSAVKAALAQKLGGLIYSPSDQEEVVAAAQALYAARRGGAGSLYDPSPDQSVIEQAIEDVTGPMISFNGARFPVTPGLSKSAVYDRLNTVDQHDLAQMGFPVDRAGRVLTPERFSTEAVLRPLSPGSPRYLIGVYDSGSPDRFAPLFTGGELPGPVILNLAALVARPTERRVWLGLP